jgi:hypothetical protein
MKITVSWDMTLCSLTEVYRHFGGTHCPLYSRPKNDDTESSTFLRNVGTFHGVTSHKTVIFG